MFESVISAEQAAMLCVPFDPDDVKFRVGRAGFGPSQALAYADTRAYIDRLNEVFGAGNWHNAISHVDVLPPHFDKAQYELGTSTSGDPDSEGQRKSKDLVRLSKAAVFPGLVVVAVQLYVHGQMVASDLKEEEMSGNENAATSPFAGAFKRACAHIGLGSYLYRLPKYQCQYDYRTSSWDVNKGTEVEGVILLPDWAIPDINCTRCKKMITSKKLKARSTGQITVVSVHQQIATSRKRGLGDVCRSCIDVPETAEKVAA